jgi:2-methylcitrate dehydratase
MTEAQRLAEFITKRAYSDLSDKAREQLKIRVLDSLACAIGALGAEPIRLIRAQTDEFGGSAHCTLIGGGKSAPDRAAFYNSALVRYLDFNDSYLAKGETCHPSDNLGAVLAAVEHADGTGQDLMCALALAYQVQCRLSDVAPVRAKGFDHTTQGSYAVAAGVAKALGLSAEQTANALAICGTAFNALRVTRTGTLSHWKGLAYPNTAFGCMHACFLAKRGITGPPEVFEGNKGFKEAISGSFEIDWGAENLERVTRTILKKYNAEVHSQSAIEGVLELKREHRFLAQEVAQIDLETFDVAHNIIGGGEEGSKTTIRTKEEADHSLPYMLAVAMLDDQVMPEQYARARILKEDVQTLLHRVSVTAADDLSRRFPAEMPCRITVTLIDGRTLADDKRDYEGFTTRPMRWETVVEKFTRLTAARCPAALRDEIISAIAELEQVKIRELMQLLSRVVYGFE